MKFPVLVPPPSTSAIQLHYCYVVVSYIILYIANFFVVHLSCPVENWTKMTECKKRSTICDRPGGGLFGSIDNQFACIERHYRLPGRLLFCTRKYVVRYFSFGKRNVVLFSSLPSWLLILLLLLMSKLYR